MRKAALFLLLADNGMENSLNIHVTLTNPLTCTAQEYALSNIQIARNFFIYKMLWAIHFQLNKF